MLYELLLAFLPFLFPYPPPPLLRSLSLSRFCSISHLIHTIKLLKIIDRSGRRIFAVVPNNKDHVPGRILVSFQFQIQFQFIILYYSSMKLILNYVKKAGWLHA